MTCLQVVTRERALAAVYAHDALQRDVVITREAPPPPARGDLTAQRAHPPRNITAKARWGEVAPRVCGQKKRQEDMSYTKFVSALIRANPGNVSKLRVSPGRCRSTVVSTKTQEEKEQQMDGCTVVETVPVELISQTKTGENTQLNKIHIDFDNTEEAYKSKNNIELLRSLLVFKLCTIDVLVEKNKEVSCSEISFRQQQSVEMYNCVIMQDS